MSAAASRAPPNTAAQPVRRVGFFYLPNGVAMNHTGTNYWKPAGEGASFELSPILTPLASHRQRMVVVSGLSHPMAEGLGDGAGDHSRGTCTWLSGVHPKHTEGSDVRNGTTLDQAIAAEFAGRTPIPSLEQAGQWQPDRQAQEIADAERPRSIIGTPQSVVERMLDLKESYQADEMIVLSVAPSYAARARTYELLAQAFALA